MRIGAHVDRSDPLAEAAAREADVVQFFLTDPQGYKTPPERPDTAALRAAEVDVYVHAPDLVDAVERVKAITGRIDLIHANGSKDPFDSGRDRHDNVTAGAIDSKLIVAVIRAAGAPVVVETPGGVEGQRADIAFLREQLGR